MCGWLPPWLGCGVPALLLLQSAPAQLSSTQSRSQPPTTLATTLRSPPPKRKTPWKPRQTCCRRCPCRAGSRGWLSWRPLPGGRARRDECQRRPASATCPRVLLGAGRCGLRRGYLALPRRCALRPLPDLRSNCRSVAVGWQGRSGVLRNAVGFAAKPIFRVPTTRLQGETKHCVVSEDLTSGGPFSFRIARDPGPIRFLIG